MRPAHCYSDSMTGNHLQSLTSVLAVEISTIYNSPSKDVVDSRGREGTWPSAGQIVRSRFHDGNKLGVERELGKEDCVHRN